MVVRVQLFNKENSPGPGPSGASISFEMTEALLIESWDAWARTAMATTARTVARKRHVKTVGFEVLVCILMLYAGIRLCVLGDNIFGTAMAFLMFLLLMFKGAEWGRGPRADSPQKWIARLRRSGHLAGMLGRFVYSATPGTLAIGTRRSWTVIPWSSVRVVSRHGGVILIEMKFVGDVSFPASVFGAEQAADAWVRHCEQFRAAAPNDAPDPIASQLKDLDFPCPSCGYNLKGTPRGNCPECGWIVDFVP